MRLSGQDQIPDCKGCKRLDDNRSAHCHAGIVASSDSDIGNLSIAVGHRELTRDSRGGLEKNVEKERHARSDSAKNTAVRVCGHRGGRESRIEQIHAF